MNNITDMKIDMPVGISRHRAVSCEIATVTRITKTQIELSNGQKWRCSKYGGWKRADTKYNNGALIPAEDARERNARLADERCFQKKVGRMSAVKFEYLPETTLNALIAVMDAYRQVEADAALARFLETGEKY